MTTIEYQRGKNDCKYGIWNNITKKFVFDIKEDTPMLAEARLFQKMGNHARKWRYEIRKIRG